VQAANEMMAYFIHNDTDCAFYYRDDFRVYRDVDGVWEIVLDRTQATDAPRRIDAGATKSYFVLWHFDPETNTLCPTCVLDYGNHLFVRPLYNDAAGTDSAGHYEFEFEVSPAAPGFEGLTHEEAVALALEQEDIFQQRIAEMMDFVMQTYPGRQFIVPYGEIEISSTGFTLAKQNVSEYSFTFSPHMWALAHYRDGQWRPMMIISEEWGDRYSGTTLHALSGSRLPSVQNIASGEVVRSININFEGFYQELQPGRYMFIMNYHKINETGLEDFANEMEWLFIEFEIAQ
jgi:hypothetical protein